MVEELVMDASVLVAAFLEHDTNYTDAIGYLQRLDARDYQLHLPLLALVETCAAINHRAKRNPYALAVRAKASLERWAGEGKVAFYPLDNGQAQHALDVALTDRLSGSDSIYATLAEQRDITLKSFDSDHLTRFQGKVSR